MLGMIMVIIPVVLKRGVVMIHDAYAPFPMCSIVFGRWLSRLTGSALLHLPLLDSAAAATDIRFIDITLPE